MNKIYFDVTDIVHYANSNSRVSGIQRVQARLIGSLARRIGSDRIRGSFWHPSRNEMVEFDPGGVFDEAEFDSGRFLARLGLWEGGHFPARYEVRRYLAPYNNRKIKRGLLKAWVYIVALFSSAQLRRMGIDPRVELLKEPQQHLADLKKLQSGDAYVFLGSNWAYPEILDFGRRHSDGGGVVVQMIYDLIPYLAPDYCGAALVESFESFLNLTPTYANRFACISDWTKSEFVDFLTSKGLARQVVTVPLAHEFDGFERNQNVEDANSLEAQALAGQDFVVCVGTIERRKNGVNLLKAWGDLIKKRGADRVPTLVFAGKMGWKLSEFTALLDANGALREKVVVFSTPSDRDLAYMYCKCRFSIYPSKYEGWGLPVGESAWFGRYVIASNATSLPEVCGDLIDYVNPDDVGDIAAKIEYALDHPEYVSKKERELRLAKLRTWDDVADQLLAVIEAK
jgi:glycosyltransferase involved in cell wall biosynthesis